MLNHAAKWNFFSPSLSARYVHNHLTIMKGSLGNKHLISTTSFQAPNLTLCSALCYFLSSKQNSGREPEKLKLHLLNIYSLACTWQYML